MRNTRHSLAYYTGGRNGRASPLPSPSRLSIRCPSSSSWPMGPVPIRSAPQWTAATRRISRSCVATGPFAPSPPPGPRSPEWPTLPSSRGAIPGAWGSPDFAGSIARGRSARCSRTPGATWDTGCATSTPTSPATPQRSSNSPIRRSARSRSSGGDSIRAIGSGAARDSWPALRRRTSAAMCAIGWPSTARSATKSCGACGATIRNSSLPPLPGSTRRRIQTARGVRWRVRRSGRSTR